MQHNRALSCVCKAKTLNVALKGNQRPNDGVKLSRLSDCVIGEAQRRDETQVSKVAFVLHTKSTKSNRFKAQKVGHKRFKDPNESPTQWKVQASQPPTHKPSNDPPSGRTIQIGSTSHVPSASHCAAEVSPSHRPPARPVLPSKHPEHASRSDVDIMKNTKKALGALHEAPGNRQT